MELLYTDQGLKRLLDTRDSLPVYSHTNRGPSKGREMEQSRLIYLKQCENCFRHFEGIRTAKYCCESCKQKAKRYRAKQATR